MPAPSNFKMKYVITTRYLSTPSKRRPGTLIAPSVKFLVAHDTGNPGSTAAANVKYYESSKNAASQSAHLFVDDREIIECIPALQGTPAEKAWHVRESVQVDNQLYGANANEAALGVEYCYGGRIDADEAFRKYVWVLAYACFKFGLDPNRAVVGHAFLDPTRRSDPITGLAHSRRTYEQLLRSVVAEYAECTTSPSPLPQLNFVHAPGVVLAAVKLNLRKGAPNTRAAIVQTVSPSTRLAYVGWVAEGESIHGNAKWFCDENQNYFWSGGTKPV